MHKQASDGCANVGLSRLQTDARRSAGYPEFAAHGVAQGMQTAQHAMDMQAATEVHLQFKCLCNPYQNAQTRCSLHVSPVSPLRGRNAAGLGNVAHQDTLMLPTCRQTMPSSIVADANTPSCRSFVKPLSTGMDSNHIRARLSATSCRQVSPNFQLRA